MPPDPNAFVPALTGRCAEVGVAVVFVSAPQGCPAYGATRWLSPTKALLMLSNRYKTHDVLWFTFFHEICHLLQHSKKMTIIEGASGLNPDLEEEADTFAANLLIPPAYARRIEELPRDPDAIASFAREIGVAPGIVPGRRQKQGLVGRSRCGELKVRYEFGG
jgi:HTH-type transcriptional regulator/antitoxin HigA